ncbi:phage terminase large subunit family protein [Inquilinus limosus]|uniref:Phage terminase large subunit GpA ATPase domain-containing protein n=1 Tax=Inquilinus limosus MP06 TaxID=1398085 RepID=A0A0A0DDD5_9PROT|nr:phage terminase large subunit family protein [Inquilinus limosus]KGM36139.1 hypothetical protein P409_00390 [Inquilinus limosus MP06]
MSFGTDFQSDFRSRFTLDSAAVSMTDWVEKNTTIKGRPFSIKGYEFQRAILDDMHPNLDVIKCSQVGLTEVQIRKMLGFLVRNQGLSALFTLPEEKLYKRVSQTRVKPIVDADAIFNREHDQGAVRSMNIMQFGRSFLYLTGCTEADATSTSADAIFNDEVDLSPQDMLVLFNSRLQNSIHRISQRFSTPTFPGFGIDLSYQASDQLHYMVRCSRCNHWSWPQFNRDFCLIPGLSDNIEKLSDITQSIADEIDIMESYIWCPKCHRALDLTDPSFRQWVAKHPSRKHARGYYVTPFSTGKLDLPYILGQLLKYRQRDYLRGFFNTVLGETYSDGNIRLEEEVIRACFRDEQPGVPDVGPDVPVSIGIDMGLVAHVTLATGPVEQLEVFRFEAVPVQELPDFVRALCKQYNIVAGGIDRHPYTPTAEEIRDISEGKILPLEYRGTKEFNPVKDQYDNITHGQINRTMALDAVAKDIRRRSIRMSGYGHYRQTIIEHLRDQVRDEQPEKPAEWKKLTGQDHFHHSLAFLKAGLQLRNLIIALSNTEVRTNFGILTATVPMHNSPLIGSSKRRVENGLYFPY